MCSFLACVCEPVFLCIEHPCSWEDSEEVASVDLSPVLVRPQEEQECPICLEPLKAAPTQALLCGHVFHDDCLEEMMSCKRYVSIMRVPCPQCRTCGRDVNAQESVLAASRHHDFAITSASPHARSGFRAESELSSKSESGSG